MAGIWMNIIALILGVVAVGVVIFKLITSPKDLMNWWIIGLIALILAQLLLIEFALMFGNIAVIYTHMGPRG
jgi:hypothetical protein